MDVTTAYTQQLKALLPPGELWKLTGDAVNSATLGAMAAEFGRVHARGDVVIDESDPRTADETLDQWEEMLGLPDTAIVDIPDTTGERQRAVTQKYISQGGQTAAYYTAVAAACGYTVTIDDSYRLGVAYCGRARCPDPLNGEGWAYVWKVVVSAIAPTALSTTELEAIITRAAPAHTIVIFEYP